MNRYLTHPNKFINGFWRLQQNYWDWQWLMTFNPKWWTSKNPAEYDLIRNSQSLFWDHLNLVSEKYWKKW